MPSLAGVANVETTTPKCMDDSKMCVKLRFGLWVAATELFLVTVPIVDCALKS